MEYQLEQKNSEEYQRGRRDALKEVRDLWIKSIKGEVENGRTK